MNIVHRIYNPLNSEAVPPNKWYTIAHSIRNTSASLDTICQYYDFDYTEDMFPFILKKLEEYGAFFCSYCNTWVDTRIKVPNKSQCFLCHLKGE